LTRGFGLREGSERSPYGCFHSEPFLNLNIIEK
jgi:hypothetical protein